MLNHEQTGRNQMSHIENKAALPTVAQLMKSTALTLFVATGLLVTTVLPAEYGIDPTGVGKVLGLTKMGEIKEALHGEEGQAIAQTINGSIPEAKTTSKMPVAAARTDEMTVVLKPDQATEIKLSMKKGDVVQYRWQSTGPLNVDAHGDAAGISYHGYGKDRQIGEKQGSIEAEFDGAHGWYWRNRTDSDVTLKITTDGQYTSIKKVL
jgi:hypothetical protein